MSRKTGGSRNPRVLLDIQGSITNIGWFKSIVRNAVSGNSPWENIGSLLLGNVVHIFFNPKKLISVAFSNILPIWRFLSKIRVTASEGRGPHVLMTVTSGYRCRSGTPRKSWLLRLRADRTGTNGWSVIDWHTAWTRSTTCTTNNLVSLRFVIDRCP